MNGRNPRHLISRRVDRRQFMRAFGAGALALPAAGLLGRSGSPVAALPRAQDAEPITLTFMHWGDLNEKAALESSMRAFEQANPHVTVSSDYVPGDYMTSLQTLAAANQLPDVFPMDDSLSYEWAVEGRIADITPYIDEYPQLQNRMAQTFYYYEPGKTHGTMNAVECSLLFYNKDMFEAAGVDAPPADVDSAYTWDQFVETAQRLTLDTSGRTATDPDFDPENIQQFGVSIPKWWFNWWGLLKGNGGDIANEDGTQYTLNSPEAVEVFQSLADLIHTHHVAPAPSQEANLPATSVQLQSRRVAMVLDGQWNCQTLGASQVPFGIGVLPVFKEPATIIQGPPTVVNTQTEHFQEALDFVVFYNDPEQVPQLYTSGLMMPLEEKYYTDQEFIDRWTNNDAHPPEYQQAAIDFVWNHSVTSPSNVYKNFVAISSRVAAGIDPIWSGETSAQEALDELAGIVQPLLQGKYPSS